MGHRREPEVTLTSPTLGAEAALAASHVTHQYGSRVALDDVNLVVKPSSFTVLLGLNGAGKSTLFSLITRLYAVRAGKVLIFGHDVMTSPGPALSRLGVVFQSRSLDLDITVQQNLLYHAALHGIGKQHAKVSIIEVLDQVALADRRHDRVSELSVGQMRRVEIARALLHRPTLLLLDEPTVGLDIKARADILQHVRELLAGGVGVLWATHLIDEVSESDDLVVLHRGKVLASGPVADVMRQTGSHSVSDAFARLTLARANESGDLR
ncbi:MAG: ATP-binding cassette domain-containing protein [Pseudomonadota bacterium]